MQLSEHLLEDHNNLGMEGGCPTQAYKSATHRKVALYHFQFDRTASDTGGDWNDDLGSGHGTHVGGAACLPTPTMLADARRSSALAWRSVKCLLLVQG